MFSIENGEEGYAYSKCLNTIIKFKKYNNTVLIRTTLEFTPDFKHWPSKFQNWMALGILFGLFKAQ